MSQSLQYQRIQSHLEKLHLATIAERLDTISEQTSRAQGSYLDFLEGLLDAEVSTRTEKNVALKLRLARFPYQKHLEDFDFSFQRSIDRKLISQLATMRFIEHGDNIIFLGPPGVGKTHLAIALGIEAVRLGHPTYFLTCADLIASCKMAETPGQYAQRINALLKPRLLIIDEVGYLPLDKQDAHILFEVISKRYEKGAIILTSNKSYTEWGELLADHVLAAAILDRLLHHATTINIKGESYRLKEKKRAGFLQPLDPTSPVHQTT
jgi:DNA replication protein DnaC